MDAVPPLPALQQQQQQPWLDPEALVAGLALRRCRVLMQVQLLNLRQWTVRARGVYRTGLEEDAHRDSTSASVMIL